MKIILVTQSEELYLPGALRLLFDSLPAHIVIASCVLLKPSANGAGSSNSFMNRAKIALNVFGLRFFLNVAGRFLFTKLTAKPTVEKLLSQYGIPVMKFTESINSVSAISEISHLRPDVIVSIQGNEIFGERFLQIAPCLNLHTAPLPRYRGLMPTFWAILNGETETAVSAFKVDDGIDTGPIYVQKPVSIEGLSLHDAIKATKKQGIMAIIEALHMISEGRDPAIPNDISKGTYYGFPSRLDVKKFKRAGRKLF